MNSTARQRQLIILGAIVATVVLVVGVAVALSGSRPAADIDFSAIPQSRGEDGAFILGSPDAPITIIEFADYGCPHCQDYHPTMTEFIRRYVATGQAKFEYRTFPTAGGQLTFFTGQISECAEEQRPGGFWEAYKTFFELAMTSQYNDEVGRIAAERMGLNYSELLECTRDAEQVNTDVTFGRNRGVSGTPAIMVRYGDGDAQWITYNGAVYDRGTVPLDVLSSVVQAAQQG
jgi:protein-disulfide isomerase